MDINGEYRIAASRETVWAALNDPQMLRQCISGCESLERTGDNEFQGKVAAAIGPVRAKFNIVITLENVVPPQSYTLTGESKAGSVGFGRGHADVALSQENGSTLLTYRAAFKVGGKLAQVGSRLVLGATKKTADDFFGCLSRELQSAEPEAPDAKPDTEPPGSSKTAIGVGIVVAGLLAWWFLVR